MLDRGLTWDLAKEQCGGDGTEKEFVVPRDDSALLWAGLHDIAKRLRHGVAQRLSPDDTPGFAGSYAAWFFAAIEAGLAFGESGEFRGRDHLLFYTSRDDTTCSEAKLSDNFEIKLRGKVLRLGFDGGYTGDEMIYNALQVGLREDIYPRLRAYIGSTGAALATETPIDSDFGELTVPKIAEAVPKVKLGHSYISGCGLSRMAFDFGERIGLEKMSDGAGRKLRLTFVRTGHDESHAYRAYATPTPNGGWQVDSSKLNLSASAGSKGDWRDRVVYFGRWSYPACEYIARWPDRLILQPSEFSNRPDGLSDIEVLDRLQRIQEVDRELAPYLPSAWEAVRAYYKKLRELRGTNGSHPAGN